MAFQRDLSLLDRSITLDQSSVNALRKSLDSLPAHLQKAAEKAVLRAGGNIILKAAKVKVPVRSGILKKSLGVSVTSSKAGISARVGPRAGVKYRYQTNKTGRRGRRKGKNIDAQEVAFYIETGTPNMAAQPFIRPAVDDSKRQVLDAMAAGLDKHLTKVCARLAKV